MSDASEAELLAAAQAGSAEAIQALVSRHAAAVARLCLELTGHPADAEDARQETLLALQRAIGRLTAERPLAIWLARVATNACLKIARSSRRRLERHRAVAVTDAVEDAVLRIEDVDDVARALDGLPPPQAALLRWKYHENATNDQIAQRLGIAPGSVRVYLHRAIAQLRENMR